MRGMELPISTLVIVLVAFMVLVGIVLIFSGIWNPGSSGVTIEGAKNNACRELINRGCVSPTLVIINMDLDEDNTIGDSGDNLQLLCQKHFSCTDTVCCKQLCGCP